MRRLATIFITTVVTTIARIRNSNEIMARLEKREAKLDRSQTD